MYYFASDTHLGLSLTGKENERERLFIKWLDEVAPTAKAIFLVGDIFDFWFEYKRVVPRGFTRLLGKFSELTDKGIEIHFFAGNHDLWAFDYLHTECGLILHPNDAVMELYGKKVFIAHGDILGERKFMPRFLSGFFRSRVAQWFFSILHPDTALKFGSWWSGSSRKSKPVKHTFRGEDDIIVKFAREYLSEHPGINLFVCGHIHCAVVHPLTETSSIAFLGEWIEEPTYGILNENGIFELKPYK